MLGNLATTGSSAQGGGDAPQILLLDVDFPPPPTPSNTAALQDKRGGDPHRQQWDSGGQRQNRGFVIAGNAADAANKDVALGTVTILLCRG